MLRGFVTTGVAERRGICAWRRLRGLESCTSYSIEYLRQAARQHGPRKTQLRVAEHQGPGRLRGAAGDLDVLNRC
ncbi:hypothetical protein EJB05_51764 [Eragrostis curvula]|uniref:Uncharacterized protein n=1 Tax=Eragrostis curvula TaxID=38414 RepID=A0A5J9SUQ9_9POAL|nr:hypothetical protein EJB05_51763 [Eragrostis curvula]TVU02732.1 hypothetical protein EJB05_51764 [Eragrostis curvula]